MASLLATCQFDAKRRDVPEEVECDEDERGRPPPPLGLFTPTRPDEDAKERDLSHLLDEMDLRAPTQEIVEWVHTAVPARARFDLGLPRPPERQDP